MFEHRRQPLAPRHKFWKRAFTYLVFSLGTIAFSLFLGMWGYHAITGISWVDSFYNASMILTGMGPALDIDALPKDCQSRIKIFVGIYALYSGVVFLAASGLLFTPVLHRFFHKLHLDVPKD